jgi:hypothetical protein
LRLSRLLAGYRGQPAVGTRALADVVARVGAALAASDPSVVVDLNPVRLLPGRAIVLDAKIARVDTP